MYVSMDNNDAGERFFQYIIRTTALPRVSALFLFVQLLVHKGVLR